MLTRAEAAAILLHGRSANVPQIPNANEYRDVTKGSWSEPFLLAAARFGIIEPDIATKELRPNEFVNRAEFLKMLQRTFGLEEGVGLYRDIDRGAWYAPYTELAKSYDVFPEDWNILDLRPERLMTFREGVLAVQAVARAKAGRVPPTELVARTEAVGNKLIVTVVSQTSGTVAFVGIPDGQKGLNAWDSQALTSVELRSRVLDLVNRQRVASGLHPLAYNRLLEQSAQRYAEDMARGRFFSHVSPSGETLKMRMEATGYYDRSYSADCDCVKGFAIAENLAIGQSSPEAAFEAWMNSPKHRSALLGQDYRETGIGVVEDRLLWVQHFGGIILPGQEIIGLSY